MPVQLPPDVVRQIQRGDLEGSPDWIEPLLRYLNNAVSGVQTALSGLALSDVEIVNVQLSHNTPQLVFLKKLKNAKMVVAAQAGASQAGKAHALAHPIILQQTSTPGQVKVTALFLDTTATRVNTTVVFAADGQTILSAPSLSPPAAPTSTGTAPSAPRTLVVNPSGSTGKVLTEDTTVSGGMKWATPAAGGLTSLVNAFIVSPFRKGGLLRPTGIGSASSTQFGIQAVNTVAGGVAGATIGGAGTSSVLCLQYVNLTTSVGAPGGFAGPFTETRAQLRPYLSATCLARAGLTFKLRAWVGMFSASPINLAVLNNASAASAIKFAAVGWDPNVSAHFMLCSGDGTTYSCVDTGIVVPTTDDLGQFVIDWTVPGQISATFAGITGGGTQSLGTKSTNVLAGNDATNLGLACTYTVITAGDNPTMYVANVYLEQN